MARKLQDKVNVIAPGGSYPFGRVRDNDGSGNGTPVNEELVGDITQFFEKLMSLAGIVHNDLPENNTDGFQYTTALQAILDSLVDTKIGEKIYDNGAAGTNTGGLGGASDITTVPTVAGKNYSIEVDMVATWVSGSAGAGNGSFIKKIFQFRNIGGVVSLYGVVNTINSSLTGASSPTLNYSIVGSNIVFNATPGSGEVYKVRCIAKVTGV